MSEQDYPLHSLVWSNNAAELSRELTRSSDVTSDSGVLETRDPHGRTLLMLAVSLGHTDCAKAASATSLLRYL